MNPLIILITAFAIFILQHWLYVRYWNINFSTQIYFPPEPVIEGESTKLTEVIINQKFLPLPIIHVKFQFHRNLEFQAQSKENTAVTDKCYRSDIFSVLPFQKIKRTLLVNCPHRGYYTIDTIDLIAYNLLMTDALVTVFPVHTFLYVYPRLIRDTEIEIPFQKIMGELASRRFVYPDPFAFRGIREYSISDPMNTVNWNATARTGELMVNTHYSAVSQTVVLLLNLENKGGITSNRLHEESIRIATTLSTRLLDASIPVRIVCNGLDVESQKGITLPTGTGKRHIEDINRNLSRIDLELEPPAFAPFLEEELCSFHCNDTLYVLIGASSHIHTYTLATQLAQQQGTLLWILPYHPDGSDMEPQIVFSDSSEQKEFDESIEFLKWRVNRNAP